MLAIKENKWHIKHVQIFEGATENIGEGLITNKFTQCKASCTLKIDVFKIPDNKNIGKLFSKYELLFLDQTNSISDQYKSIDTTIPHT